MLFLFKPDGVAIVLRMTRLYRTPHSRGRTIDAFFEDYAISSASMFAWSGGLGGPFGIVLYSGKSRGPDPRIETTSK